MHDFNNRLTPFLQVPRGFSLLTLSQKKFLTLKQTKRNKNYKFFIILSHNTHAPKGGCVCCVIKLLRVAPLSLSKAESYCWFCIEEKDTLCSLRFSDQKVPIICSSTLCLAEVWADKHNQQPLLCLAHDKTCTSSALKIRVWATSKGYNHNPLTPKPLEISRRSKCFWSC